MRHSTTELHIVHSYPVWLPLTQTWMYHLVRSLQQHARNGVLCETFDNHSLFYLADSTALRNGAPRRYALQYVLRKAHLTRQLGLFASALRDTKPDIVHSHFGNFAWRDSRAVVSSGAAHAATFYGADLSMLARKQIWRRRYRELFRTVDAVFCEGPHMAATALSLGAPEEKTHVQPLGVDLDRLTYRPRSWDGARPLHVLLAASFRPKKGLPDAIVALGKAARTIDLRVTIVGDAAGDGESAAEKRKILRAIDRSGMRDHVRMVGYIPFDALYAMAYDHDLFIQASRTAANGDAEGGAPVSIIEFAATGMPIVSSRHCDIPFVIEHGATGFLADEGDCAGIAAGLHWWAERAGRWQHVLKASRRRIEQRFNMRTQATRLFERYLQIAEHRG